MSDTEQKKDADELLDWLCWVWAIEGQRFYPPEETATECMESLYPDRSEFPHEKYGWERGQHTRAYKTAVERFRDLEERGFDPQARAQREIERSREQGLDLEPIDWEWWEEAQNDG